MKKLINAIRAARLKAGWITVKGARIFVDADGKATKGPTWAVSSSGKKYIQHPYSDDPDEHHHVILADAKKVDEAWQRDQVNYVGSPGHENETPEKRARAEEFLKTGQSIHASKVLLKPGGVLSFTDGRHRFAALRDSGESEIGLTVPTHQAKEFQKQFGVAGKMQASRARFTCGVATIAEKGPRLRGRAARRAKMFRTFEGVAYNGGIMYPTLTLADGREAKRTPVVIDLDQATIPSQKRPVLDDHDETTEGVIGQTTMLAVRKSDYTIPIRGVLYTEKDRSKKILDANDGGHEWQLSIGADFMMEHVPAGEVVHVNGRRFVGPLVVARNAYVTDVSFVAVGGDDTTWATIAARRKVSRVVSGIQRVRLRASLEKGIEMDFDQWLKETFEIADKSTLSETQLKKYKSYYDEEQESDPDPDDDKEARAEARRRRATSRRSDDREERRRKPARANAGRQRRTAGTDGASTDGKIEEQVRRAMRMEARREAQRVMAIDAAADGNNADLVNQAKAKGWSVEKFELAQLRASRSSASAAATREGGDDEPILMEAALLVNSGMDLNRVGKYFDEKVMNRITAARWRGFSLVECGDQLIKRTGGGYQGARNQKAHMMAVRNACARLEASGFTSLTLSSLLENASDKILLDAYLAVETKWQQYCAVRSLNDFKIHAQYALDPTSVFQKVGAQGDFAQLAFTDRKYTLQLDSYGVRFKIDFQTWRNDDLGAIQARLSNLGDLSANTIDQVFHTLLLSGLFNEQMFHANNRNYDFTNACTFGIAGLTFAEDMWERQVRPNGSPLGVSPQNLFVGTKLKTAAGQVFTSTKLNDVFGSAAASKQTPNDNPHQGKYKPTTDPYLNNTLLKDSTSGTATPFPHQGDGLWMMTAKQGNNAPFHVGFLDGNQSPKVEVIQNQSEMIGFELASGLHFGVGFGDPALAMCFDPDNVGGAS